MAPTTMLILALAGTVSARSAYKAYLPNGLYVPGRDAWGHYDSSKAGDNNINAFGSDLNANGLSWTQSLCTRDSDTDGYTNGFELGDPCCTWRRGQANPSSAGMSNPADALSRPPASRNCSLITCSNGVDPCVATSVGSGAAGLSLGLAAVASVLAAAVHMARTE